MNLANVDEELTITDFAFKNPLASALTHLFSPLRAAIV
jgi:hypothetical protein